MANFRRKFLERNEGFERIQRFEDSRFLVLWEMITCLVMVIIRLTICPVYNYKSGGSVIDGAYTIGTVPRGLPVTTLSGLKQKFWISGLTPLS
jgi:hypothetical protein